MTPAADPALLERLASRRSVAPRRLRPPGPSDLELAQVLRAAMRAPDHGRLLPWRVVDFPAAVARAALAEAFVAERLRRRPDDAAADTLARTRAQALDPPTLLAFIARIDPAAPGVPPHEQWLAAGAALGNLLNGFDALGYGACVLSGERCADAELARAIGADADAGERLVGWISVGTAIGTPRPLPDAALDRVWSRAGHAVPGAVQAGAASAA